MQRFVERQVHIVGICRPLGIDIKHYPAVVTVSGGNARHAFERIVKIVRRGGRGIYAYADERIVSASSEDISVIGIVIGNIQPLFGVIVPLPPDAESASSKLTISRRLLSQVGTCITSQPQAERQLCRYPPSARRDRCGPCDRRLQAFCKWA